MYALKDDNEPGKVKQQVYLDAYEVARMHPKHPNYAVALVAACIDHYEYKQQIPLDAIILNPANYELYRDFVRVTYGEEVADARDFWWHGIQIRKEKLFANVPLRVEFKKKSQSIPNI